MERVQITGGGNGVYTDTKGRRLYTMGDYSPAPGDWVWTNGVTIYGHQSAGNAPCNVISNDSCLPYTCYGKLAEDKYGRYTDQLVDLSIKKDETDTVAPATIAAYAGDKEHAYVGLYGNYKGMKWFNVLTGEYLGTFTPDDACLDQKGNLVTIEHQNGTIIYRDQLIENHINRFAPNLYLKIPVKKESFDTTVDNEYISASSLTEYGERYKITKKDNLKGSDFFILIRVNGKVVKSINKNSGFIKEALLEVEKNAIAIVNDVDASGDSSGSERSNVPYYAKPKSGLNSILTYAYNIKIYPDLSYSMNVDFNVSASAYPFISFDSIEIDGNEYSVANEYSASTPQSQGAKKYLQFIQTFLKDNPTCYKHECKVEWTGIKTGRYKDWITVIINANTRISIERGVTKNNYSSILVRGSEYYLSGRAIFRALGEDLIDFHRAGTLLGKYKLNWVEINCDSFPLKKIKYHHGFKNYPMAMTTLLGVHQFSAAPPDADILTQYVQTCEILVYQNSPFYEERKLASPQINYEIGNDFSLVLELADKYNINSVKAFKLYYHDEFVIGSRGTTFQNLAYFWSQVRAIAIGGGRFLISFTNQSIPPLIIENGQAKPMSNIAWSYINYTLAKFKNKKRLKLSIEKLLKTS